MREWPDLLGGRWVRGRTMHPPLEDCLVSVTDAAHPVSADLQDFTVVDERYSYLETRPDVTVLYDHHFEDARHPLVWARDAGPGRVVYDALGHDVDVLRRAGAPRAAGALGPVAAATRSDRATAARYPIVAFAVRQPARPTEQRKHIGVIRGRPESALVAV